MEARLQVNTTRTERPLRAVSQSDSRSAVHRGVNKLNCVCALVAIQTINLPSISECELIRHGFSAGVDSHAWPLDRKCVFMGKTVPKVSQKRNADEMLR
jgi:hypothetical protein